MYLFKLQRERDILSSPIFTQTKHFNKAPLSHSLYHVSYTVSLKNQNQYDIELQVSQNLNQQTTH